MSILTVWHNQTTDAVRLHQLSDDQEDGTASEQIAYIETLEPFAGFECVSSDYTGPVPDSDASLWRWNGSAITASVPIPDSVTPRQVRLLLLQQGLLDQVEAMIAAQDTATKITWQYASEFKRNDPLLNGLGANLGLSSQLIDQFFIAAASI